MNFDNDLSYWFIFFEDQIFLEKHLINVNDEEIEVFNIPELCSKPSNVVGIIHNFGMLDGKKCFSCTVHERPTDQSAWALMPLREAFQHLDRSIYDKAGHAYQLIYWDTHSRFCSICGNPTKLASATSKRCIACNNETFPPIYAATIVLVRKGDEALLIRAHNFKGPHYGLVAGFLEVGESLEECVLREVKEETDLEIDNLQYFGSQPWPYPSGIMIGFTADYKSGSLKIQESELVEAQFFSPSSIPPLASKLSIARRLIDAWLEGQGIPISDN